MNVPRLAPEHRWSCPNCNQTDVTNETRPHTRFHTCAGLRGLTAPFVSAGTRARVEARDRDDYVGRDLVTTDGEGRPVMSVVTTRDDGQDVAVFAPCATASFREGSSEVPHVAASAGVAEAAGEARN